MKETDMKKPINKLWYVYLTCCAVLTLGLAWRLSRIALNYPEPFKIHPQSVGESQHLLKNAGYYNDRVDFIWGPNTETAYCNYMNDRITKKMAKEQKEISWRKKESQ